MNTKIIPWACNYLSSQAYTLKNNLPENVQITPWSDVLRFATSDGNIYLKHTPKLLALEASIDQILHDQFHAPVPEVLAHNAELNCFLMKDAGIPLRKILKEKFDTALLCKAIDQFTSMQLAVADHVNIFLDIGVPDWRLNKLPDLYAQLLSQENILIADGLSAMEISELSKLLPRLADLCEQLSHYSVKQSLVQPDFHDNNILVNTASQTITIIDLGEIAISHPFFSLVNCLQQMKKHYSVREEDDAWHQLMNACLKNYLAFESRKNLLDAFAIAQPLWFIYAALAHYRLILACDEERLMSFQRRGRLASELRKFMIPVSNTRP